MSIGVASLAVNGGRPELDGLGPFPSWPQFGPEEETGLIDVLRSGAWGSTSGQLVATFETEFAAFHRTRHATALNNCTAGIAACLRAADIGVGDEVIVPPYTFIATASAALMVGATPIFADIDPTNHLLDPAPVEAAITDRTRAIIPVHLAGNVADLDAFVELGRRHDLLIIEDAAQAIGASWRDRPVGGFGAFGVFSFQSSKNMTAGEGGIVTTDDDARAAAIYSQVNLGRVRGGGWYQHETIGYNLRLTEFQAAVLRAQLDRFEDQQAVRDERAAQLRADLADVDGVLVDAIDDRVSSHGHHLFIFRLPELGARGLREAAAAALRAEGLPGVSTGYLPLHRNPALQRATADLARRLGRPEVTANCPATDLISTDTLWLPHETLLGSPEQIAAVGRAIAKIAHAADQLG
ncbi:DegT/DnrJ/EryC1/StrS family aminotransferase [Microlunatus soli]|uniref:dTDP-4-amino-4,6-dideoxygalactose transaminase n=1 Tax=Microlunatus soli TaxID=630515 RepID=A0A1H1USL0_9ACTN|nr:DegT/DnrJ/EryC1/StrS family aminotransferase [Microlunatus soli]SDS75463.1 dTDP-4-amino-4,6-dideoxygalactose transaminase [Microlunatus soli]